ncbi:BrnT family toxin [Methylobacterium sp. E-065]|uniref:BrnT family toxin n=1 Tax=Methylobacterium sp. E-065 TaxID=2836583 RepID=UPI001FB9645E|nr:BrnT family toxin [Methylobacterium sp. E-065]MCJ2021731.1 BrnT family toxin [Methylobacterium sp. E-065]
MRRTRRRAERGFGFADAAGIFLGRCIEKQDTRQDYGEVRMVATGEWDGDFYTVVYTDRREAAGRTIRRLISARLANRKERRAWHA